MVDFLKQVEKSVRKSYSKIFFIGLFLLCFIFFNILISSALLIIKISVSKVTPIISLFCSVGIVLFFLYQKGLFHKALAFSKDSNSNDRYRVLKDNIKNIFITILIPILIIVIAVLLNGKVIDYTWDGNSYQKATIGLLADGWNPLYENVEDFQVREDTRVSIADESKLYINTYARASHIFAANIYKLTGNIECGKSINTISIIMVFLLTLSFLLYKDKSLLFSILFSVCVSTYSVVCAQFLTNYIDLLVYLFLYLLIYCFFVLEEEKFVFSKKEILFLYVMILSLCINIKLSLFAYAGIFCAGYYIWYIIRVSKSKMNTKDFWDFTIASSIAVIIGIFIIGLAVYPKNLIKYNNPFYPLIGPGKVEIMVQNQPDSFKGKSPIEKYIIATFSRVEDIVESDGRIPTLKIPFTFHKDELNYGISSPDVRISGNGVLFSGIFIISMIVIICLSKNLWNDNHKLFVLYAIPFGITIAMIFLLNESWWARYFPQSYFAVLFAILLTNHALEGEKKANTKMIQIVQVLFICMILFNNGATFVSSVRRSYIQNVNYNEEFMAFENERYPDGSKIEAYTISFNGAKYNIFDKYPNYNIVFKTTYDEDEELRTFLGGKIKWKKVN